MIPTPTRPPDKVRENAKRLPQEIGNARIIYRLFGATLLSHRAAAREASAGGEER